MRRSLSHMLNRQSARGLRAWTAMVAERAAAFERLRRAGATLKNHKLGPAWRSWVEVYAEAQAAFDAMDRDKHEIEEELPPSRAQLGLRLAMVLPWPRHERPGRMRVITAHG